MDSLYSIVQMPGGVPVATVAIGNATNAGLLAVRMLGATRPELREKMVAFQVRCSPLPSLSLVLFSPISPLRTGVAVYSLFVAGLLACWLAWLSVRVWGLVRRRQVRRWRRRARSSPPRVHYPPPPPLFRCRMGVGGGGLGCVCWGGGRGRGGFK
eukprot:COSAG04_NODE_5041_length_1768_cov_2.168364_1_plen_154_part_10